jgi:alpha-tubulin suppressor-like RCC1 family protein
LPPSGFQYYQVAAGYDHSCAITVDGALVCWGSNQQGQLVTPQISIDDVAPFVQLAAGLRTTCAITELGQEWCWGEIARQPL